MSIYNFHINIIIKCIILQSQHNITYAVINSTFRTHLVFSSEVNLLI